MDDYKAGEKITHSMSFETRVVDEENRIIEYVASTESVDRYNTRVKGWSLDHYMKNPVILFAHNYALPPIGRAVEVTSGKGKELRVKVQFAPKETYEFADTIYKLSRDGYINALSVGFIPGKVEFDEKEEVTDLLENELLEVSVVPVPANPEALALAYQRGVVPVQHQPLLVSNLASDLRDIEGVDDMNTLNQRVENWVKGPACKEDALDLYRLELDPTAEFVVPPSPSSEASDVSTEEDKVVGIEETDSGYLLELEDKEEEHHEDDALPVGERDGGDSTDGSTTSEASDHEDEETVSRALAERDYAHAALALIAGLFGDYLTEGEKLEVGGPEDYKRIVEITPLVLHRAGAKISRRNQDLLWEAIDRIRTVLAKVSPAADEEDGTEEPTENAIMASALERIEAGINSLADSATVAPPVKRRSTPERSGSYLGAILSRVDKLGGAGD